MGEAPQLKAALILALLAIVTLTGLVLFFSFESIAARTIVVVVTLITFALVLGVSLAFGVSDNRVRLVTLTSSVAVLFGVLQAQQSFDWLYKPLLIEGFKRLGLDVPSALLESRSSFDWISASLIVAWVAIVYFVTRGMRSDPAMGIPQAPLQDVLPHVSNLSRLHLLKRTLRDRLDHIDFSTRWNEANFVSLEAEVQILEGKNLKRKVVDLIKALRLNPKTRLFVVLGEPGTGKSVALRKLTRDLLGESQMSDRIPIYLNLKEWKTPYDWSLENRPNTGQFHDFVYHNLLQSIDFSSQSFLTPENYAALLNAGYFFFILDSFDEIPAVLDHDENSWIIDDLSAVISRYVLSGTGSRGIVASRLFRQPKIIVKERSVFEIQPFNDERIIRAIKLACSNPEDLIRIVLTERNDLGTIARNPFLLHLIINHYNQKGAAPRSQAEMFESFIELNLQQAKAAFGLEDISEAEIYDVCERIAAAMFVESRAGLEIGEPELRNEVDLPQLPYVLRFLSQARLARVAPVSGAFSFSHRRFNEYFLVRRLSSKRAEIPFDAIQTDSRWRDALVLYAEIADDQSARRLAHHAWQYASHLRNSWSLLARQEFVKGRHALRFLAEGFRNRTEFMRPYQDDLEAMVREKLSSETDYIEMKTVLEGVGLLPPDSASQIIVHSLSRYPGWISEEAAAAARYLKRASALLTRALYHHCVNRPFFEGIAEARRQRRILKISSAFEAVTAHLGWYLLDALKTLVGPLLIIVLPIITREPFWIKNTLLGLSFIPFGYISSYAIFSHHDKRPPKKALTEWLSARRARRRMSLFNTVRDPRTVLRFYAFFILTLVVGSFIDARDVGLEVWRLKDRPHVEPPSIYVSMALGVIAVLTILPLHPMFWLSLRLRQLLRSRFLLTFGSALLSSGAFLIFILYAAPDWLRAIFIAGAGLIGFGGLFYTAVVPLWFFVRDWRTFKEFQKQFIPRRSKIAYQLGKLRSPWWRVKYVQWVDDMSSDHLPALRDEANLWPDGKRPQRVGDEATIRLAQADMRWLNLS